MAESTPPPEALKCGGCQGNGNCPRCKGSGLRPLAWGEMSLPAGAKHCPRCGGNGVCVGCGGCGWVVLRPAPPPASVPDLVVAHDGPYSTLSAALAAAAPGALIRVRPGKYREKALLIDKPVQIVGDGPAREIVIRAGRAIVCRASGITWQRLRLDGALEVVDGEVAIEDCAIDSLAPACVAVQGTTARVLLRRCRLTNACGHALLVRENSHTAVEESELHDTAQAAVFVECGGKLVLRQCKVRGASRAGVFVDAGSQCTLEGCEVTANQGPGLTLKAGAAAVLERTRVGENARSGVLVCPQANLTCADSAVMGNRLWGIVVQDGGTLHIARTQIQEPDAELPAPPLVRGIFQQLAPYFYDAPDRPAVAPTPPAPTPLDLTAADPAVSRLRRREVRYLRGADFPEAIIRKLLLRGVRPEEIAAISPRCARLVDENRALSPHAR